jgi:ubiquinone/menaquinone biosynthesis C-methylase UbiE
MITNPIRTEYDRLAAHYDRRWQSYIEATLKPVLEAVGFRGDEAVLDVPCGTGELGQRLLEKWPNLCFTGVDLSAGMLEQARAKMGASRARWIEADVAQLRLPNQSFDCVICANSFHYFRAPSESLAEIYRVLRPGGRFILVDWCDDYWTCKACGLWLRWTDRAFHRIYSLESCESLVKDAGFHIDEALRFRINWLWGLQFLDCSPG